MSEPSGRNEDGTFAEGNTFSDGRNKYLRQQHLKAMFAAAVTDSEIQRIAYKLTALALDGDMQAAKLLLTTLFKQDPAPAALVQVNNGEQNKDRLLAIANRVRMDRLRQQAGIHEHRVADKVIEVPAKRGTGDES